MGRGRQKAKHTKVARELKYFTPDTDLSQLEKELAGGASANPRLQDDLAAWPEYAGAYDPDDDFEDDDEVAENRTA
jgi:hypothetical protein